MLNRGTMRTIVVDSSFESWRAAARMLLAERVPPERVLWTESAAVQPLLELSANPPAGPTLPPRPPPRPRVPAAFLAAGEFVACHRDPQRWPVMYRVLWRLTHGEPCLLELAVDVDVRQLVAMERAVRRDRHRMTAFVRFRRVMTPAGEEHYVAWHRPEHRIVRLAAPFFVDRFRSMRWTILTSDDSMSWDGHRLCFGEGVPARCAPRADELESLWRTYYASTFNPARVNLAAMRRHVPLKHWATMPELHDLGPMLRDAPARVEAMMGRTAKSSCTSTGSAADFLPPKLTLPQLREAAQGCRGCELYCNATQAVFGEGPKDALVMFIGEQPGDQEDRAGRPFVGPAGQMLDEMIQQAGIPRDEVYVTNAVKHFKFEPRGKRRIHSTPNAREVAACKPWLEAEIKLVRPQMIVTLGATAAKALLGAGFRLTRHRHELIENPWSPWLLATMHPSALLRIPDEEARRKAREDFLHDMTIVARQLQKQNLVRATARQRREAVVAAQDAYRAAHPA